ncbi:MAG: 1-acyl-sn-glycerol-3-phosphate acyltransferase [Candidatus Kerfeldbacteria bacterium]|nr:1-acyl-sn-glycerol-3-phosphate acyltransferase [Candidatus Kerfeldbacteria bacterium]
MAYPIARRSLFPFVSLFAKRIEGTECIPLDQPVIVVANHLGLFDPIFIGSIFIRRTKHKIRFLVDTRNLFWKTIGSYLQRFTNSIPVRPNRHADAIDEAVRSLRRGDSIGVFPEGKVNTSPTLLYGRSGAVRISLLADKPILPVGIENTNVPLLTIIERRFVNRQEGIVIRFGQPFTPSGNPNDPTEVRGLTDDLMRRIAGLSRKVYNSG